jgi:hypothetical protein
MIGYLTDFYLWHEGDKNVMKIKQLLSTNEIQRVPLNAITLKNYMITFTKDAL